jgi:hypothetical protein
MGVTRVNDLISRVGVTLQDPTYVRWPQQELLNYVNDAQRQIVLFRPDANAVNENFSCAASAKQSLPGNALRLINITRNSNGRAITKIERTIMDVQLPNWYETPINAEGVRHYLYDASDPKTFYLYPRPTASHQIEIIYASSPVDITLANFTTDNTTITLDDIYANAIMDYMMYRAYQKDSEFANANRAMMYFNSFAQALGVKNQSDGMLLQAMSQAEPGRSAA